MRRLVLLLAMIVGSSQAQALQSARRLARDSQPQPTGKGSISGSVLNEVTKEPIKRARVALSGLVSLVAVTDDSGHFAFKMLPSGQFSLMAQAPNFSIPRQHLEASYRSISLAEEEQKSGVTLTLVPGGAISGRLTDEEGGPLANCHVSTGTFTYNQGTKNLSMGNGANTNEKGEYRIVSVIPGNYVVLARCQQRIPLPHPLMRRNSGVEPPTMSYPAQFYPGTLDIYSAGKLTVTGGSESSGIDIRLSPGGGVTVSGRVSSIDAEGVSNNVEIRLESRDSLRRGLFLADMRFNRQSGEFKFLNVIPGSYDIFARASTGDGRPFYARVSMEIGTAQPEPVEVMLLPAMTLTGNIVLEGDQKVPLESLRVTLNSMEAQLGWPQPSAQVQKDGTFSLTWVVPGRWMVVGGGPSYIKSVSLNNQEFTSPVIDIPAGAGGPMKIVESSAWAQVEGSVTGLPSEPGQLAGILWRPDENPARNSPGQVFNVDRQGRVYGGNIQPGRYLACAVAIAEPWRLLQDFRVMAALKSHCDTVELQAGKSNNLQLRFIPTPDLETILAATEN